MKEYAYKVNAMGQCIEKGIMTAASPSAAFELVLQSLSRFELTIEIEVQGALEIVTTIIRKEKGATAP